MSDMTHEQMIADLTVIGGGAPGRGTISAAARALDVSERTVANAARGDFAQKFADKVAAVAADMRQREAEGALHGKAGTYACAHVKDRQPGGPMIDVGTGKPVARPSGTDIWDECVVTRMRTPMMIMHVAALREKDEDGNAVLEKSTYWIDKDVDPARRERVLEEAVEEARAFLADRSLATADAEMRASNIKKVVALGIFDEAQASRMSDMELKAEIAMDGRELEDLNAELSIKIGELMNVFVQAKSANPDATDLLMAMRELGGHEMAMRVVMSAQNAGYDVPIMRYLAGQAYSNLQLARKGNYRRGREDRQTAQMIEDMTVVIAAAEPAMSMARINEFFRKSSKQYRAETGIDANSPPPFYDENDTSGHGYGEDLDE